MKLIFFIITLFSTCLVFGQENSNKRPELIIVINNEIVPKEKADQFGKDGFIKDMRVGVSEEERKKLFERLGNKIPDDGRFIAIITLFTDTEKKAKDLKSKMAVHNTVVMEDEYRLRTNDTAANFTVAMLDGQSVKLSDLRGKIVILSFWATWCTPCLLEFYDMPAKIIEPFKDKGLVFLPISKGEKRELVSATMEQLKDKGLNFNSGIDQDEKIWNQYGRNALPKSFLIDQNGIIRYVSTGYNDVKLDVMAIEIKKLLPK